MEARGVPTSRNHSFWTFFCPTKDGASSIRAELKREEGRRGGKKVLLRVLTMRRGSFTFTRNLCDSFFFLSFSLVFFFVFSSDTRFSSNLRLLTVLLKNVAFLCVVVDANLGDWSVFGPKPSFFQQKEEGTSGHFPSYSAVGGRTVLGTAQ